MKITVLCLLLVAVSACAENLPTNETSEPQGAAGAAALSEDLSLGVTARIETEIVLSYNLFGTRPYCEDPIPGQTNCHVHASPWGDDKPWFFIIWGAGRVPFSQTSQVFFAQRYAPAIYLGQINCTQTSCTSLQ